MYKFLPEQIENLRKQMYSETLKLKGIVQTRKESYAEQKTNEGEETRIQVDNTLLESFIMNTNSLNDIKKKLLNCEVVERSNSDEIEVGSTFEISLFFDDEEEKSIFTLVETRIPKDPINFISVTSPLGKAILGKKQGDNFKYVVENSIFSGRIDEIVKEKVRTNF